MQRLREKLLWLIRLLEVLEIAANHYERIRRDGLMDGKSVSFPQDWRMIQTYLMPEIFLVMGQLGDGREAEKFPAYITVPALGEYYKVTSVDDRDVLYSELADLEQGEDILFRELGQRVARIPEKNTREKGKRLSRELEKLLAPDV